MKINIQAVAVLAGVMAASYVAAAHAEADQLGQPDFASSVASTSATSATSATSSGAMTFTVVAFSPSAVVPSPTQQFQLASLMTLPGSKFKWQPRRGFDRQALLDLSLSDLRQGMADVPPVYLNRFPADLAALRSAKKRKDIFIKTVLPLVLRANNEVRAERQRMLLLLRRDGVRDGATASLSKAERTYLDQLAVQYGVATGDLDELQRRVDVVPASLALAQGAEESGWGTSRFARQGNAVFGQRTFRKGGGLVPLKRERGASFEVKAFNSLYNSVRSYVWNLNTHFAYKKFREERATFRHQGQPLDGYALIGALKKYSERGHKYIDTIRVIMQANRLYDFDDAELLSVASNKQPS
ncbi:MAG: hypothetical protein HOH46_19190 [Rhodospirillaceae bacterium]|nr:hypothetical protein [Rhodospirillaceae bacterium]MBT6589234.1 hypothetical protein [Rhodospirillaceae bacterium]MBT6911623.1 hypothetical protein [Rhodospirillaceae bacterium]MBT7665625.1 hypothetical protein [Rhodospirillaceae bacterium]